MQISLSPNSSDRDALLPLASAVRALLDEPGGDVPNLDVAALRPLGEQVERIVGSRRNAARWSVSLAMAMAMGIRQGEALGARWTDLDLDAGTWRLSHGLQRQTYLLEQNVDVRVVMKILGHSQISLAQNTYQHVMPKIIADATERVGCVLFSPVATTVAPSMKS